MNNKFNKFISVFLVLVLCFTITIQGFSPSAHALTGVEEALVIGGLIATISGAGIALSQSGYTSDQIGENLHKYVYANLGTASWQEFLDDIAYNAGTYTIGGLAGNIIYNTIHNSIFGGNGVANSYTFDSSPIDYPSSYSYVFLRQNEGSRYGTYEFTVTINGHSHVYNGYTAPEKGFNGIFFRLVGTHYYLSYYRWIYDTGWRLDDIQLQPSHFGLTSWTYSTPASSVASVPDIAATSAALGDVANPKGYTVSNAAAPGEALTTYGSTGVLNPVGTITVIAQPQPTLQPDEPLNIPDLGYDPGTDTYLLPDGTTVSGQTVRDIVSTYGVTYLLQYLQYMLDRNNPRPTPTPDPNNSQLESNLRKASLALLIGYLARTLTSSNIQETTGIPSENYPDIGDIINSPDSLPTTNYYQQQINNYYNTYNSSSNTGFFNWWKQAWQNFRNWLDDLFHTDSELPEAIDYGSPPSPDISPSPSPTPNPDGSDYHGGWIKGLLSKLGISSIVSHISAPWGIVYEWIQSISGFLSFIANFLTALPRIMVLPFYGSLVMFAVLVFIKKFTG